MQRRCLAILVACLSLSALADGAPAQGLADQNMAFDRQFDARLQQLQQQNALARQQLWQSYLQQNGPWLRQAYQSYMASGAMPVTFEQFAY